MKKTLIALAALSAFAGAASAQSSVTLSGGIDAAIQRVNGDWNMSTGNSGRTNFTLSGREDLGGGMYAFFALNYRFNQGTGQTNSPYSSTQFFRQDWVGLGGSFGDVRLGRMLPPLQEFNGGFDPFGTETIGSTHVNGLFNVAGTAGGARYNNTIYYRSPNLGGLAVHASISAADKQIAGTPTTDFTNGSERPVGLAVAYGAGPLRFALAYDRNAVDLKTIGVYGGYNLGVADLMFQYEKSDASPSTDVGVWSIGARVPMGASTIKVGYRHSSDLENKKFALGLDYSLSKRTIVYADVAKSSGDGVSSPADKAQFDVGIWHKF
jgi:general bacterial porin, GBP family